MSVNKIQEAEERSLGRIELAAPLNELGVKTVKLRMISFVGNVT